LDYSHFALSSPWDRGRPRHGIAGVPAGVTWDSMRPACVLINKTGALNRALQLKRSLPAIIYKSADGTSAAPCHAGVDARDPMATPAIPWQRQKSPSLILLRISLL